MNVSAISSTTNAQQGRLQGVFQQRAQDFKNLQSSLQSGDINGAQQALSSLQRNAPRSAQASGAAANTSGQSSPLTQDFQAIQSALQSGDLSGAQNAFASLKQDMQGAHRVHGQHHHGTDTAAGGAGQSSGSTASATGTGGVTATAPLLNVQA